ncbi:hypothetical protein AB1Y20_012122 [Prymnesium parvum]|uniref:Chorein N-terminal domain-containing protein n=1 Tax=Prymnesium parvum TaxID=97485 RepID=A0AB34IR70_PRYPA
MLEDIAASVLQRLLGRYVQGLEGRNLRVAVWSGRVVLENLMLRPEALAGLLPVHVREGFIGRIEMVVPWHKLRSLPVTIELQQVLVLAAPFNQREWTPSDETAYQLACKRAALHTRKRELQQLVEELKGQRPGTESELVPLLSRVVDNVQLTISGLHVRYEDATNVGPRRMCAMGLRLGAVRIKSVDECGRTRFVERTSGESVRKVVELDEISIYLDAPRAPRVAASASAQDLQAAFHTKPSALLLRPLSGRAVLEFHPAAARPHWRSAAVLKVALEVVALRLTDVQCLALGGLLHYAQHHKKLHRRQRFASLRPSDPPLVAPRLWWRYCRRAAYTEWAPKPARLTAKTLRARRAYMDGYREVLVASVVGAQAGAHVRVRLQELEDTLLNADQVVAFRALAAVCAQPALALQQRKQQERLERKRRERERKAAEERRRAIDRERREAEKLQREARRRLQVRSPRPSVQLSRELQRTDEAAAPEGEGAAAEVVAEESAPLEEGSLPPLRRESSARVFDDKRRAVVLIQAHSRGRILRAAYRRKQLAAPVLQALVRGVSARNSVQWRVQSATILQRIWRGARERRAYGRLKRALLLDEDTACEVMRHVIAMIRRGRAPGNSLEATHRAQQLFQHGLECNKAGLTLQACEYFQRAALCWKVGSTPASALNVLLSLANMYLKLGQPAPALMAYNYTLQAKVRAHTQAMEEHNREPGASERHMEMARRKQQEALLLEKAQTGHASPSLMENDVALFAAGWIKYLDEQTTDGIHARDDMEPTGRASISSRDAGVAWPLGGARALSLAAAGRSLTKGQRLLLYNLVMPLGSSGLAEASKPHERSQGGSGSAARAPPPGERLASRHRSSKTLPAIGSESEHHTAAPLQLQLGASLDELSITLTHHDHPPEDPSGLLLLRMQKLELHHQRRSEGAMMLRMSANALDCYDLRVGASLHHHIVGTAGRRAPISVRPTSIAAQHTSRQHRRRKPSSLSPPFVDRFRLPPWESSSRSRDPIADDGLKAFGGAMREKMGELSRRLRRRPTMDGAFGGEFVTEIVPAGPTKVVVKIRRIALTENSQRPRRLSQAADKIKDGLDKLRGDTMSSAPAEVLLVTTLQRHTRGWLARKGAALLRELRQLSLLCEELHRGGGSKRILQSDWSVHMWVSGRARQATNTRRVAKVCFTMPVATEVVIIRSLLTELSSFFRTPLTELSIKAASLYASGGADWAELLQRRPELQLSLDIRTPRIIIPLDTNSADGPLLALDMGRLTFASEGQKFTSDLPRGADEDFDFGAPSDARSSNDESIFYDTFDAQVHNITAQLLASSTELQTASLAHTVIVERFQLGIRFQKCRLPASALRLVRSFREGGLPRVRLSFCTGRCVQVRLSARQWALLRGVKQDPHPLNTEQGLAADANAHSAVQDLCNTGAPPQTAAGQETCSLSSEQSTNGLGSADRPSPTPERRARRRTPSYTEELLSSTLFRAASLVLTDYASSLDAELQALVVVPMFSVQLNYLPHGATEEAGLLECSLHDIRAEVTKSQHETTCDLQLQAMHAHDLTDISLPCLATSEPDYSRISSADPAASPSYRRERGRGVHGQETSPSRPSAPVPRQLVRVQIAQRTGRPTRVNVQLNTFHFEWNAPCIATLKRFFGKPAPSGAGASELTTGMPAPPPYGAGLAGHPPQVGVPPCSTDEEWHILDKAEGGETETAPATRAVVNVVMTRLSLSLVQESSHEHSGAPLCVVTMKSLSFFTETAADGTLVMRGSIHSLRAHDVGRHRDFDTRDFPMLSIGSPQETEPAMEFRYRKIFSVTKRPPAAHISYESELNMKVVALRVIWVQQWVVGAFEYLDNSILASVVRGVSDLSIERVWVPPNRWKPIRLNFLFTEARLVFPRSMNVLQNETMLEQHSIEVASSRMSVTNTLERLELPGCEGRLLICDRVAIHFDQPQVTSRLDGEHRVSFGYPPEQVGRTHAVH